MAIKDWSKSPSNNNSSPPNGAPEGMAPSYVNDCIRQFMADVRTAFEAAPWFDYGVTPTWQSSASFSLNGDLTNFFAAGVPVEIYGSTMGTAYSQVKSSTYVNPLTTITLNDSAVGSTISQVRYSLLGEPNAARRQFDWNVSISGSLALNGTLSSSRAAPSGFTRVSPNRCVSTTANDPNSYGNSIGYGVIKTITAPSSNATSIELSFYLAACAIGTPSQLRNATAFIYSDTAGTSEIAKVYLAGYEFLTAAAGAVINSINGLPCHVLLPTKGANVFIKQTNSVSLTAAMAYQVLAFTEM